MQVGQGSTGRVRGQSEGGQGQGQDSGGEAEEKGGEAGERYGTDRGGHGRGWHRFRN